MKRPISGVTNDEQGSCRHVNRVRQETRHEHFDVDAYFDEWQADEWQAEQAERHWRGM